jgi:drug/metabolite transporter (DMT)-like permease
MVLRHDRPGRGPRHLARGGNVHALATGRGSCFGFGPTPSLKIATNTAMCNRMGVAAFGGAVRALGAAKASLPSFTPAVSTLLGIVALGHLPTRLELLGMVLATLGLLLAILGPGPRRAKSQIQLDPR